MRLVPISYQSTYYTSQIAYLHQRVNKNITLDTIDITVRMWRQFLVNLLLGAVAVVVRAVQSVEVETVNTQTNSDINMMSHTEINNAMMLPLIFYTMISTAS